MKDQIIFSRTGYEGHEEEVLSLRNRNRPDTQTRAYMDWRYLGQKSSHPPQIFWAMNVNNTLIGMASIIFRPYWVDNSLFEFAVLGDISINEEWRGQGISKHLFRNINFFLVKESIPCAFVIPNPPAAKSLSHAHWKSQDNFAYYVRFMNPEAKLYQLIKSKTMAKVAGRLYRQFVGTQLSAYIYNNAELLTTTSIDDSFNHFWQAFPKKNMIISDRSTESLHWRYEMHPYDKYEIRKLLYNNDFVGYIIYTLKDSEVCYIVDMLAFEPRYIKLMLRLFLKEILAYKKTHIIRIKFNSNNLYDASLRQSGFVKRYDEDVFQIFTIPSGSFLASPYKWFISIGDKDT